TITNTSGAAPVTATATGTYLVGPFQATVPVTVNVEGASILCTWTSNQRNPDCTGVGIDEAATSQLGIWPNPSNGSFRLQLPENTNGITDVQVTDLTGRTVASTQVAVRQAELHLQQLPAGMYLLNATNNGVRYTSVISIQH
ncbi:MAG TPA: T9SS type A sorting domain-containing protein, partial [Flavobacteriales bacterium]|nr:T9SS type A sorting domain-containing protein [Flavobacteriales bacterium]